MIKSTIAVKNVSVEAESTTGKHLPNLKIVTEEQSQPPFGATAGGWAQAAIIRLPVKR